MIADEKNIRFHIQKAIVLLDETDFWENVKQVKSHLHKALELTKIKHASKVDAISITLVKTLVSQALGMPMTAYLLRTRRRDVIKLRSITMFLCRDVYGYSNTDIAGEFGCGEPNVSVHIQKVRARMKKSTEYADLVNSIKNEMLN